jgi:DNA-binding NarL/FixJ family response regulator
MATITVAIADDHPVVLSGLQSLIAADGAFSVVATASTGRLILEAIRRETPQIAVLDLNMPELTGLEVLQATRQLGLPTRVALLAANISDAQIFEAVSAGVAGLLLKESAPETLMDCLRELAAGRDWLPDPLVNAAMEREGRRRRRWEALSPALTARELQIVGLVVAGSSTKQIAFRLQVSDGTAKVHLNNIFRKLEVTSRAQLLELAMGQVRSAGEK